MTPDEPSSHKPTSSLVGLRLVAIFILFLGGLALTQVSKIGSGAGYIVIGPRFFPILVGIGLLGFGFAFLLRTTLLPDRDLAAEVAAEEATTHWPSTSLVMLSLVVYAFLLGPLGYTLATSLFFPVTARILGSQRLGRDIVIGVVLGLVIYLAFTRVLGVRLPAGILSGIL